MSIGTKAAICAAFLIALNTVLSSAGYWSLSDEFANRARADMDMNLRTLTQAFGETFGDAKISLRDGVVVRAEIAKMPEFKDHAIVDRAVTYIGGNATLFVLDDASGQFFRRSTNVKKENGDRAVGTTLAADHPAQAVLRRGEAYKGPAVLFGKSFSNAYQPIMSLTGKVIEILYVGIPTAQLDSMLTEAIQAMAIAGGLAALLVLVMTMLIVRRITTPLKSVAASSTAIAEGAPDVQIAHAQRHDEIGEIARTIVVFKANADERRGLEVERAKAGQLAAERPKWTCVSSSMHSRQVSAALSTTSCSYQTSSNWWRGN